MSNFDLHGSHIPLLVESLRITTGDVLEMGMGWSSTPLLHWICKDMKRNLVSFETDHKWIKHFDDYRSDDHMILPVDNWEEMAVIDKMNWGVVLIDHRPALRRHKDAIRLKDTADIIILHDTEPEIDRFYAYRRVWEHFKYRYDYDKFKPYTTAVSNTIDVAKEFK